MPRIPVERAKFGEKRQKYANWWTICKSPFPQTSPVPFTISRHLHTVFESYTVFGHYCAIHPFVMFVSLGVTVDSGGGACLSVHANSSILRGFGGSRLWLSLAGLSPWSFVLSSHRSLLRCGSLDHHHSLSLLSQQVSSRSLWPLRHPPLKHDPNLSTIRQLHPSLLQMTIFDL